MNALVEFLGFTASAVSFILWWPQAIRVWRCRRAGASLRGVSLSSQALLLFNAALWGAYGVVTNSLWVGAPGLVNAPLAVATIVIVVRGRRTPAGRQEPAVAPR
jgi:uncharacterized protein with PQ loop repeat